MPYEDEDTSRTCEMPVLDDPELENYLREGTDDDFEAFMDPEESRKEAVRRFLSITSNEPYACVYGYGYRDRDWFTSIEAMADRAASACSSHNLTKFPPLPMRITVQELRGEEREQFEALYAQNRAAYEERDRVWNEMLGIECNLRIGRYSHLSEAGKDATELARRLLEASPETLAAAQAILDANAEDVDRYHALSEELYGKRTKED